MIFKPYNLLYFKPALAGFLMLSIRKNNISVTTSG
ncbi:MAG: hypothetical protein ACJA2G_003283, partial [Cognaticolwellia sp.]